MVVTTRQNRFFSNFILFRHNNCIRCKIVGHIHTYAYKNTGFFEIRGSPFTRNALIFTVDAPAGRIETFSGKATRISHENITQISFLAEQTAREHLVHTTPTYKYIYIYIII